MRLRFAPSPTGHLHVGNARTALFNWLLARGQGGAFVLRIEDTDAERSTAASEASILDDLRWLGLLWDEGPDAGGPVGPYRQSERLAVYRAHADRLLAQGDAYRCFCTPGQLDDERQAALAGGHPPKYSGRCRALGTGEAEARLAAGEAAAIRFKVPPVGDVAFDDVVRGHVVFHTDVIGDPVIVRSDGRPAYNFAVVVDDALMGITHVIRGEDHVSNTPRQVLLYRALGATPPTFAHLSLVMGPDHAPLSKRHGATSVAEFRANGILPEALVNHLALIGWSPGEGAEILPAAELASRFRLEDVGKSAGVFDVDKLAWVNRHYIKAADPGRLAALALPYFERAGVARLPVRDEALGFLAHAVGLAAGSVDRLGDLPARLAFLFAYDAEAALQRDDVRAELAEPGVRDVIAVLAEESATSGVLSDRDAFRALAARVRARTGQKGKALFHPMRVALTGDVSGMELDLAVPAIERGAALEAGSGLSRVVGVASRTAAFAAAVARLA
jgi:glutamyl-tRNA synthetase/nondiscriminating glutamyl-tRNA synthetase